MRRLATLISALFHPLLMPLACIFVAYRFDWAVSGAMIPEQILMVYLIVALSTLAFPAVNILLLRWYGVISSFSMPIRAERSAPFISTIFFFALGYYMLRKGNLPDVIYSIMTGSILALIAVTLINFKWKISAHAVGIFGLVGSTVALFQIHNFGNIGLLAVLILIAGAVLTSRLLLSAHTPAQIYVGAGLGFLVLYLSVFWGGYV